MDRITRIARRIFSSNQFRNVTCFVNGNTIDFAVNLGKPLPFGDEKRHRYDDEYGRFYAWFEKNVKPLCNGFISGGGEYTDGKDEYVLVSMVKLKPGFLDEVLDKCRECGMFVRNGRYNLMTLDSRSIR